MQAVGTRGTGQVCELAGALDRQSEASKSETSSSITSGITGWAVERGSLEARGLKLTPVFPHVKKVTFGKNMYVYICIEDYIHYVPVFSHLTGEGCVC